MKRIAVAIVVLALALIAASNAAAVYSVSDTGNWPESWPKELEPLRKTSKTFVGPMVEAEHYLIPFDRRKVFEAAWPKILALKTKGAPIILLRPSEQHFMNVPAGVIIHTPPEGTDKSKNPEKQLGGYGADFPENVRGQWMWTTYIELVVDGRVVDLNRIELPAMGFIVDERFKTPAQAAAKQTSAAVGQDKQ